MKKIAVLGPKGTYSDVACRKYLKEVNEKYTIEYYPSILKAIHAVDDNTMAIVPVENALDGFVMESLDQIILKKLNIKYQVKIPVDFAFISTGSSLSSVKKVFCQFKAYGQCSEFISSNDFEVIKTESNIESLNKALLLDEEYGAIVPMHTVEDSKVHDCLIIPHVADAQGNETRFAVLDNSRTNIFDGDIEAAIVVNSIVDKPGMLYEILNVFHERKINLKAILSRPDKTNLGKYNFYVECSINEADQEAFYKMLDDISVKPNADFKITVLGVYKGIK